MVALWRGVRNALVVLVILWMLATSSVNVSHSTSGSGSLVWHTPLGAYAFTVWPPANGSR